MNKSEFVAYIANKQLISKKDAELVVDRFTSSVRSALKAGMDISLVGFGNFTVGDIPARDGINPSTREAIRIEAYKQPKFKVSKALKDDINGK